MSRKKHNRVRDTPQEKRSSVAFLVSDEAHDILCLPGYRSLDRNPEIMTGCRRIAELIGTLTIHIMENTESGDKRITNELSRKIDIEPCRFMSRKTFIEAVIMNLLLYGNGNSIVRVHTDQGYLSDLEPVAPYRVSFQPDGGYGYHVSVDGIPYDPDELLHFVLNPDESYPSQRSSKSLEFSIHHSER